MTEDYKHLNGHLPDNMNDIFKLRENIYNQSPKLSHLPDRKHLFIEMRTPCYSISCLPALETSAY